MWRDRARYIARRGRCLSPRLLVEANVSRHSIAWHRIASRHKAQEQRDARHSWPCAVVAFLGVGLSFSSPRLFLVIMALFSYQTPSLISSPHAAA